MPQKNLPLDEPCLARLVGTAVDIASSAYMYRADGNAAENPPESWLALMHCAGLPLDKPMDMNAPAIKQALCGLLWEEIRPVQTLKLTWAKDARRQPVPDELVITTLDNQGDSSSWWHDLKAVERTLNRNWKPTISSDGHTYVYQVCVNTCGIVIGVAGKQASDYDVPKVSVEVLETWKTDGHRD